MPLSTPATYIIAGKKDSSANTIVLIGSIGLNSNAISLDSSVISLVSVGMSVTASVSGIPSSTVVYSVNTGTSTAYISKPATANISSSQITFTAPTGVNDVVVVFRPIDFIAASVDVSKNVVITYNVNNPSGSGLIVSTIPCTSFAEAYYVLSDINTQLTSYYNQ